MSKRSLFKEIGTSPIEENINGQCYDKDKSDDKAYLSTSDNLSIETEDHRDCGYIADLKSGDYHSSIVGKKLKCYDKFPCLRSHISMYLESYFCKNPGPSKYDYYREIIYDDFRADEIKHKEEDNWNVKGLLDFLNNLDLQEYLNSLKDPPPLPPNKGCVPVLTEKENEEYEENLCNISYGMTLEEYRAWNERDAYFEYWPSSKDFPRHSKRREHDVVKDKTKVRPEVDLKQEEKFEAEKSFPAQDEKNNSSGKKSKEKKKKQSRWKRFLSCFNCFKCVKSQEE